MKGQRRDLKKKNKRFHYLYGQMILVSVGSGGSAVNYSAPTVESAPGFIIILQQLESAFLVKLRISAIVSSNAKMLMELILPL